VYICSNSQDTCDQPMSDWTWSSTKCSFIVRPDLHYGHWIQVVPKSRREILVFPFYSDGQISMPAMHTSKKRIPVLTAKLLRWQGWIMHFLAHTSHSPNMSLGMCICDRISLSNLGAFSGQI
jgi:hypothetical protein